MGMRMRLLLIAGDHIHKVIKKPGSNILLSGPGLRFNGITDLMKKMGDAPD